MQFSRQHPHLPPKLFYPLTDINRRNIRHPLFDSFGCVNLKCLQLDHWNPTFTCSDIIRNLQQLFNEDPVPSNTSSRFVSINEDVQLYILSYLSIIDIKNFGLCAKNCFMASRKEELWASLYYNRCKLQAPIIYAMEDPGH
jgi:hypothetical protein